MHEARLTWVYIGPCPQQARAHGAHRDAMVQYITSAAAWFWRAMAEPVYEGTEKRLELVFGSRTPQSQRRRGRAHWDALLREIGAHVLDHASTQSFDAYLLSESSLFVYTDRVIILTCGQCRPFAALAVLSRESVPPEGVEYTRVPFMAPALQPHPHRSFGDECTALQEILRQAKLERLTTAETNGGDAWHCFHAGDATATGRVACYMYGVAATAEAACRQLTAAGLFGAADPSACILHTHAFVPAGFSLNGAAEHGAAYWTMHVTPERGCSYVSLETNATMLGPGAARRLVGICAPERAVLVCTSADVDHAGDAHAPPHYTAMQCTRTASASVCVWTRATDSVGR